jgi:hypothetical protein
MTMITPANTADSGLDEKKAVSDRDAEFGGVVRTATSGSESVSIRDDGAGSVGAVPPAEEPGLGPPFSKARCIALVATVTGASFLNVSLSHEMCSVYRLTRP